MSRNYLKSLEFAQLDHEAFYRAQELNTLARRALAEHEAQSAGDAGKKGESAAKKPGKFAVDNLEQKKREKAAGR